MNRKIGIIFIIASITLVIAEKCKETTHIENNCKIHNISEVEQEFPCMLLKDFSKDFRFYFKPSKGFDALLFNGYNIFLIELLTFSTKITKTELKYQDDWNEIQFKKHHSKPHKYLLRFEEQEYEIFSPKHVKLSYVRVLIIGTGSYVSECYSEIVKNMTHKTISTSTLLPTPTTVSALKADTTSALENKTSDLSEIDAFSFEQEPNNDEKISILSIAIVMGIVIVTLIAVIIILIHMKTKNIICNVNFGKKEPEENSQGDLKGKSDKDITAPKEIDLNEDYIYEDVSKFQLNNYKNANQSKFDSDSKRIQIESKDHIYEDASKLQLNNYKNANQSKFDSDSKRVQIESEYKNVRYEALYPTKAPF